MPADALTTHETKLKATIKDLYRLPENDKAEIVNRELVIMSPTGGAPNYVAVRFL